jgi:hypothetical protein
LKQARTPTIGSYDAKPYDRFPGRTPHEVPEHGVVDQMVHVGIGGQVPNDVIGKTMHALPPNE